jgi:hypothetical protein
VKPILGTPAIDYVPAIALFIIAVIYLVTGYGYTPQARAFPVSVAWAAIVLAIMDVISRTHTPLGETLMRWFNPAAAKAESQQHHPLMKQLSAVLMAAAFVALIVVIGFLYAIPVYVFASLYLRGRRPLLLSVAVSAGITLFIWALFTQLLKIELYPGMLFSEF